MSDNYRPTSIGAERATKEQRQALQEIARGMDRAAKTNDDIAFMRLDREFNRLMIEFLTRHGLFPG